MILRDWIRSRHLTGGVVMVLLALSAQFGCSSEDGGSSGDGDGDVGDGDAGDGDGDAGDGDGDAGDGDGDAGDGDGDAGDGDGDAGDGDGDAGDGDGAGGTAMGGAGSGGEGTGGTGPTEVFAAADFPDEVWRTTRAICEALSRCGHAEELPFELPDCDLVGSEEWGLGCSYATSEVLPFLEVAGEEGLEACTSAFEAASCSDVAFFLNRWPAEGLSSCALNLGGVGDSCDGFASCGEGMDCVRESSGSCGSCVLTTAELGDGCSSAGGCAPGAFCHSFSETCLAMPGAGEACVEGGCAPEHHCDDMDVCRAIETLPGEGETCLRNAFDGGIRVDFRYCAPGLTCVEDAKQSVCLNPLASNEANPEDPVVLEGEECDPQAQECAPGLVCGPTESSFACQRAPYCHAGEVDDPCGDAEQCAEGTFCALACSDGSENSRCLTTSQCGEELICNLGVCTAAPAGGACPCASGQFCQKEVCVKLGSVTQGEGCTEQEHCATGLYCETKSQTCALPFPLSSECEFDYECQSGRCSALGRSMVCQKLVVEDERCGDDGDCESGLRCAENICIPILVSGDTCSEPTDCPRPLVCDAKLALCVDPFAPVCQ